MVYNQKLVSQSALLSSYNEYDIDKESGFAIFSEDGSLLSYNDTFYKILGLDKTSIIGKNIFEIFKLSQESIQNIFECQNLSKSINYNKHVILDCFFCSLLCKSESKIGLAVISDKSKGREYLTDLSNNLAQLKTLIDKFDIGFVILDESHKIVEANNTFAKSLGYTVEECLKLTGWDYIQNFSEDKRNYKFILNDTYDFKKDNFHITKSGEVIPVKATCSVGMIKSKRIALCFYENIQQQIDSKYRIEKSEKMLNNFITNSSDVVLMLDKDLEIKYLSTNTSKVFCHPKDIREDKIVEDYLPLKDENFIKYIRNNFNQNTNMEFEYSITDYQNTSMYFSVRTSTLKVNEQLIICYIRDITKDKKYIEELKTLSYTDQLTQLYNRKFMEEQLIELRTKDNLPISVISADLDGLKEVNDTLGHQAGDELLKLFSNILLNSHKIKEEVFRIGGDEFLIIATNTDSEGSKDIINLINLNIDKHNSSPSSLLKISVSMGYETTDQVSINLSVLMAKADREMYLAKNGKKSKSKALV